MPDYDCWLYGFEKILITLLSKMKEHLHDLIHSQFTDRNFVEKAKREITGKCCGMQLKR